MEAKNAENGLADALDFDAGEVVGFAHLGRTANDLFHAVIFTDGRAVDLGVSPGFESSSAERINQQGHILGNSTLRTPERTRAFIYRDGRMISLNHRLDPVTGAGWRLRAATGINERGDIVGWGHRGTAARLFLLTPMDEP